MQICPRKAAATDTKDESTVADVVNGGGLLGDPERMTQRQDLHRGTDLDMAGARADGARQQHGRGQHGALWREAELASQTASRPPRSATSISSNALSNACASLTPRGRSNS